MKKIIVILLLLLLVNNIQSQEKSVNAFDEEFIDWYNKDYQTDKILGTSVDLLYKTKLKTVIPKDTIIVAVIDGGVDINHEDLTGKIWINTDEIPDNQIDDDENGYTDDVYGWNFIGNEKGENINFENFEYTRIIKNKQNKKYSEALELYEKELTKRREDSALIIKFDKSYNLAKKVIFDNTGIRVKTKSDLKKIVSYDQRVNGAKKFLKKLYSKGFNEKELENLKIRNHEFLAYFLNTDFNPREIINDNPNNFDIKNYGNNNVTGPKSDHGTSVAGIIAANRDNRIGINGIASCVKIMSLRVVPNGDERDKDIALAIIYAVDNGARIINMSFGKKISPNKELVDHAVKYAENHNVLIIHAAGNYGIDIDKNRTYPCDSYMDSTVAKNWINVGASNMFCKKDLAAEFSNFGKENVDLFAPGINLVSLDSAGLYNLHDGTSVSAPVVTGIAALILSYFPELTFQELIEVLEDGCFDIKKPRKVIKPGLENKKKEKVAFSELSKFGGIVNAYSSYLSAEKLMNNKHTATSSQM
ncbi:S8 family serine peptidase [Saccharicrinis sp. FJH62]|uniref:S8 family serine peptidase n=1 Tax=Saccharicrinis sp. FJH62 TaxID=3344657 RepID=UPI0035D42F03